MTARIKHDPRYDFCRYGTCSEPARGSVWPKKYRGRQLEESVRACGEHLDQAEGNGLTVMRDSTPTRPSLGGCELRRPQ